MKRELGDIIRKSAARVSLSESERERLERVVVGYVRMKPIRNGEVRPQQTYHWYQWVRQPLAAGLVLALVISGTGVSFAAEGAVPGDVLYPVKVSINEEVRASFAFSNEERGQWEATRAERRLEEAAVLAVAGKLDTKTKTELAERFDTHSERAVASAESFEDENALLALNLASDFETRLKAHEELLEEVDDDDKRIIEKVRKKLDRAVSLRHRAEGKLAFAPSPKAKSSTPTPEIALFMTAEADPTMDARFADTGGIQPSDEQNTAVAKMRDLAVQSHKRAGELFKATAEELDAYRSARAEESLTLSLKFIDEGDKAIVDGEPRDALDSYRESVTVSNRLAVFLKASQGFEVKRIPDVREYQRSDNEGSDAVENDNKGSGDDFEEDEAEGEELLRRLDLGL